MLYNLNVAIEKEGRQWVHDNLKTLQRSVPAYAWLHKNGTKPYRT